MRMKATFALVVSAFLWTIAAHAQNYDEESSGARGAISEEEDFPNAKAMDRERERQVRAAHEQQRRLQQQKREAAEKSRAMQAPAEVKPPVARKPPTGKPRCVEGGPPCSDQR
jgi:hypothetical protein